MTTVTHKQAARHALERGVSAITDVVKLTLGPAGRNVVLSQPFGTVRIVNDGVTIAREVGLSDHAANLGVQLIREVCIETHDEVGDGTTTAAVLTQALIAEGLRNVVAGANPVLLRAAIQEAAFTGIESIKSQSKPVQDRSSIKRIAALSAGNDENIGRIIADALEAAGKDGVITIEESKSVTTTFERASGMQFDKGFVSPYLVTDTERMESVLDQPLVLCIDKRVATLSELVPILEQVAQSGSPLLIIAQEITGEALAALVVNHLSKIVICCAVAAPEFGEDRRAAMEDIAALTNSQIVSEERGVSLESISIDQLGKARKVHATRDATTIVANTDSHAEIEKRITAIKYSIEHAQSDSDKRKLRKRLGRLMGGIGVIKVGAHTETELRDLKLRFENGLNASLSAMEEGYVAGGGTALIRASQALAESMLNLGGDRRVGFDIVRKAFEEPLRQIANNAGLPGNVVVEAVKEASGWSGFDALSLQYVDMGQAEIIDSVKVVRTAIQNAASVAALVITTEALVAETMQGH